MPALNIDNITLTKQANNILTLNTENKYVDKNVQLNIDVRPASASVISSVSSNVKDSQPSDLNRNISESIGDRSETKPTDGYYFCVETNTDSDLSVATPGWISENDVQTESISKSDYYAVDEATINNSCSVQVVPNVDIQTTNVMLSNENNGIAVIATGGGVGSGSASASVQNAGYVSDQTYTATSQVTESMTMVQYISGVAIPKPESGSKSFSIEMPNRETTMSISIVVDADGNVIIE